MRQLVAFPVLRGLIGHTEHEYLAVYSSTSHFCLCLSTYMHTFQYHKLLSFNVIFFFFVMFCIVQGDGTHCITIFVLDICWITSHIANSMDLENPQLKIKWCLTCSSKRAPPSQAMV